MCCDSILQTHGPLQRTLIHSILLARAGFNETRTTGSVGHIRGAYRRYICSPRYQQGFRFRCLSYPQALTLPIPSFNRFFTVDMHTCHDLQKCCGPNRQSIRRLAHCTAYGNRITMHTSWSLSRSGYKIILGGPHNHPGRHNDNGSGCRST